MEGFEVLSVNHTGFTVDDLDEAVRFFEGTLGFELVSRAPRDPSKTEKLTGVPGAKLESAYLRRCDSSVEIVQFRDVADQKRTRLRPVDSGSSHLAVQVDDIETAAAACGETGGGLLGDIITVDQGPNAGNRIAYFQSSSGIVLELIEKASA
ncbi:MAG: VOC family protein [Rhodospirillales bacterium]|nr:VOC family protein [Rhodospirillales bacterium]